MKNFNLKVDHTQENTRNRQSQAGKTKEGKNTQENNRNQQTLLTDNFTVVSVPQWKGTDQQSGCKARTYPAATAEKHISTAWVDITSGQKMEKDSKQMDLGVAILVSDKSRLQTKTNQKS